MHLNIAVQIVGPQAHDVLSGMLLVQVEEQLVLEEEQQGLELLEH